MYKIIAVTFICLVAACSGRKSTTEQEQTSGTDFAGQAAKLTPYAKDRLFLKNHHPNLVELRQGTASVLICPAYQGRVMTSSADGKASYGWINYNLIRSGKRLPHMNAFGGEDRFWLGPEGGQYALFFKKGDPFDAEHWQTPAAIDSEPFTLGDTTATSARFTRNVSLTNYAGTTFTLGIERAVRLLSPTEIKQKLAINSDSITVVGIQSDNAITNRGTQTWIAKTGMPSIWILSMLNASLTSTIIIPFRQGAGQPVNDSYFGKVPAERLRVGQTAALFTADAHHRSKIGVSPARATNWIGSYDPATKTLTLATYDFDPKNRQYVNSAWEQQKEPYSGDVINAYNDGPMKRGQPQMGKFYELESSSPAAKLAPGARQQHRHTTFHVQGSEQQLRQLAKRLLLTDLGTIR